VPSFNYAPLAAKASELVTKFGKAVTLRRLNSTPPDPTKPWLPPADPRAAPAATLAVDAVIVEPSSLKTLGENTELLDWLPRSQKIAIIASTLELKDAYSELVDGAETWRIQGVSTLNPGGTRLLHFLGVAR
jgi:hypothetical protein